MSAVGSIIIIGGGASGILLAAHLLRRQTRAYRSPSSKSAASSVAVWRSRPRPQYIVNVPAANTSAHADEPDHFRRSLSRTHPELPGDPFLFAPRSTNGECLSDVLQLWEAAADEKTCVSTVSSAAWVSGHATRASRSILPTAPCASGTRRRVKGCDAVDVQRGLRPAGERGMSTA